VDVVDAKGRVVPTADVPVAFTLSGPAAIIGLNNGDPTNHEPQKGTRHSTYHGVAQIIVQSELAGKDKLTLHATSPGLNAGDASVNVIAIAAPPAVAEISNPPLVLMNWKRSPVSANRPDPNQQLVISDMNSCTPAHPGALPSFRDGVFAIYRTNFTPRVQMQKSGSRLIIRDIVGKAHVYINEKLVAEKTDPNKNTLASSISRGEGERVVSILIEAPAVGTRAGLGGPVTLE
jgi:beta-galactosidase